MIKIYTPKEWLGVFSSPSIVIESDGLIYGEDAYNILTRAPIGKVDLKSGYVYGEDFASIMPQPIGVIKKDGNLTIIFGEDYGSLNAQPIFYINGNEGYSAEAYYRAFRSPDFYIANDAVSKCGNEEHGAMLHNNSRKQKDDGSGGLLRGMFTMLQAIVLGIGILAMSAFVWVDVYYGAESYAHILIANIIALAIGCIVTYEEKGTEQTFSGIFWVSALLFEVYIIVLSFVQYGFGWKAIGWSVLGLIVSCLYCVLPAAVLSIPVKMLRLRKQKRNRNKCGKNGHKKKGKDGK